ncbi:MAG: hypothetical protein AABW64_03220, partial [Nanoarchaeota archaeon]
MDKKAWKKLQEDLKERSIEEQLAELRNHLNNITDKEIFQEVQTAIQQRELQQIMLAKKREQVIGEFLSHQPPQQQRREEQVQSAQQQNPELISLENVVKTIVSNQQIPSQTTVQQPQYAQTTSYNLATTYNSQATQYSLNQDKFLHEGLGTHVFAEKQASMQQREREEEERRATGSTRQALESRDFAEYKTSRQQKKFQV